MSRPATLAIAAATATMLVGLAAMLNRSGPLVSASPQVVPTAADSTSNPVDDADSLARSAPDAGLATAIATAIATVAGSTPFAAATPSAASSSRRHVTVSRGEHADESSFLDNLHDLAASDPLESLRLAREALERFPASPNAPEFQWNVVKAFYNMGRLEDAKDEARLMVSRYPDSDFTGDVERHLLNPLPNP